MTGPGRRGRIAAVLAATTLSACTFGGPGREEGPTPAADTYRVVECPDLITASVIDDVVCGRLTVPETRPGGARRITVHVARVAGGSGEGRPPLLVFTGVGQRPNYGAIAPLAQRTGREVLIVDGRGTSHAEPALECPEVEQALSLAQSPETERAAYLDAVGSCRLRLEAEGIDVAAYDLTESAADLAELRKALGIERWDLISYSTASRVAVELLRIDGDHVGSVVLDSPELPGMDPQQIAASRTVPVIRGLLATCASEPRCARRFPGAAGLYDAAVDALGQPLMLTAGAPGGGTGRVRLDRTMLLRVLRAMTSDQASSGASLSVAAVPLVLQHVVGRDRAWLGRELGTVLLAQEPFCLGHAPQCLSRHHVSIGVWLTTYCRDVLPFTRPSPNAGRHPLTARLDDAVCGLWDVGRGDARVSRPVRWDGPALVVLGARSTYTPGAEVREALSGWTNASFVTDPTGGHNVLPNLECTLELRNDWLADPAPVTPPPCIRSAQISWMLR